MNSPLIHNGHLQLTFSFMKQVIFNQTGQNRHQTVSFGTHTRASNERSCLSRDLCCGVSCHPSRLYSALDRPPCRSVSTLHLELHPSSGHYSRAAPRLILLSSARARSVGSIRGRDLFGREEIEEIR